MTAEVKTVRPALPPVHNAILRDRIRTHPSFHNEAGQGQAFEFGVGQGNDYRRDAFKGDALLKAFLSEQLYEQFPLLTTGSATTILAKAWSNATLAEMAVTYKLHENLRGSPHQLAGLKLLVDVRASLFEAYIYAIHIDSGNDGYDALKGFLRDLFTPILEAERKKAATAHATAHVAQDHTVMAKSRLNEAAQRRGWTLEYFQISRDGPPHAPTFICAVKVDGIQRGAASGASVKQAEHGAAAAACRALGLL